MPGKSQIIGSLGMNCFPVFDVLCGDFFSGRSL